MQLPYRGSNNLFIFKHEIYSIMEFVTGRKKVIPIFRLRKQRDSTKIQTLNTTANNSPLTLSLNNSLLFLEPDIQSTILDDKTRAKASLLLSTPVSPRQSFRKSPKRDSQLSLMYNPKKRVTVTELTEALRHRKKLGLSKFAFYQTKRKTDNKTSRKDVIQESAAKNCDPDHDNLTEQKVGGLECPRRNPSNFFSLSQYFQLVFSKIQSKPSKEKLFTLVGDLAKRYEKYPETIPQDVEDIRKIACKLKLALGSKQVYVQLRPFEALEVDGEFARLIFHLTHQITTRKYKNYDLAKIYKQIEYCSRKLELHNFTLRVCFELGQIYKEKKDQFNSHAYFAQALKLSIFLNDKFHEEKAIDCFGLTAYSSNRSGQAHYFHENASKLNLHERQNIQEKYSNLEELAKISTQRQSLRNKGTMTPNGRLQSSAERSEKRNQTFNFSGEEYSEKYDIQNKKKFKQNIKKYIQCPVMRSQILVAKSHINKIERIGQISRYKNFEITKPPHKFTEDMETSSEILLTHHSLNRRNPEYENRLIEKERRALLDLISYYTNQIVTPCSPI